MENKSIFVLGKEVTSCEDCSICHHIYDDNPGVKIICGYTGNSVFDVLDSNLISKDCPFSKPLTKEDIESCGFTFTNVLHCDSDELIEGYEKYVSLTDRIIIHETKESGICIYKCHCYNEISGNWEQTDLFRGTVGNLSEFKLLLKQLNIA